MMPRGAAKPPRLPKKEAKAPLLGDRQTSMKQFLARPAPPPVALDTEAGAWPSASAQSEQQYRAGPPHTAAAPRAMPAVSAAAPPAAPLAAPPAAPPPPPLATTLNDEQRQAVEEGDGLVSVEAGPGSGKTRVIVARVLHLLQRRGVPPARVLALTFSSRAAAEMAQRVRVALAGGGGGEGGGGGGSGGGGGGGLLPRICTFHSLCAWLLRRHGEAVGVAADFTVLSEAPRYLPLHAPLPIHPKQAAQAQLLHQPRARQLFVAPRRRPKRSSCARASPSSHPKRRL